MKLQLPSYPNNTATVSKRFVSLLKEDGNKKYKLATCYLHKRHTAFLLFVSTQEKHSFLFLAQLGMLFLLVWAFLESLIFSLRSCDTILSISGNCYMYLYLYSSICYIYPLYFSAFCNYSISDSTWTPFSFRILNPEILSTLHLSSLENLLFRDSASSL